MVIKNKNGWVKVLEVFVSILLVMGVIFFVLNRGSVYSESSRDVYEMEISILKIIQLNETFRGNVLDADMPVNWSGFDAEGLGEIKDIIEEKKFESYDCQAKVCSLRELCVLDELVLNDVYVQSVVISSDSNSYSPRQLKIFCWEK